MNRLDTIVSLLKGYDTVIDIGSDHGLVLKKALDLNYIEKGIATDISKYPLDNAKKNLAGYNADFVLSNGFSNTKECDFDCAVIAGMGAHTIVDILKNAPRGDITYIIQSNKKHPILRKGIEELGFCIHDELIVYEKYPYIIMVIKRGHMKLDEKDLLVGPILKNRIEAMVYYKLEKSKAEKVIIQTGDEKMVKSFLKLLEYYSEVINNLEHVYE